MCCTNAHNNCTARAICQQTEDNDVVNYIGFQLTQPHVPILCAPSPNTLNTALVTAAVIDDVVNNGQEFAASFSNRVVTGPRALGMIDEAAAVQINKGAIYQNVRRKIQKTVPSEPESASEIVFSNEWRHLLGDPSKELFVLTQETYALNGNSFTIIIFGLMATFEALCGAEMWFMDGTFKTCPSLFYQLFTIHFFLSDRCIPGVYILLSSKAEQIYVRCFSTIRNLASENSIVIRAKKVMVDFELAIRGAIKVVWPLWEVFGCLFHYKQAIMRHMKLCGLEVCSRLFTYINL